MGVITLICCFRKSLGLLCITPLLHCHPPLHVIGIVTSSYSQKSRYCFMLNKPETRPNVILSSLISCMWAIYHHCSVQSRSVSHSSTLLQTVELCNLFWLVEPYYDGTFLWHTDKAIIPTSKLSPDAKPCVLAKRLNTTMLGTAEQGTRVEQHHEWGWRHRARDLHDGDRYRD